MNCQPEGFHKTALKQREASDRSMGSQHRRQISPRPCGLKGLTTSKTGFAQRTAVIQIQSPCLGMGCVTTLTPARTPRLRLSQHNDTCKNIKDWHNTLTQQEHQGLGCLNTMTPARTSRIGLWHNTLTPARTPSPGLCHNTLTPARTPWIGLCHNTMTSATSPRLEPCHNTLTPATTPRRH